MREGQFAASSITCSTNHSTQWIELQNECNNLTIRSKRVIIGGDWRQEPRSKKATGDGAWSIQAPVMSWKGCLGGLAFELLAFEILAFVILAFGKTCFRKDLLLERLALRRLLDMS